jgi:hypothetical protein
LAGVQFPKSCRKFLWLELLYFISYSFLDLSNIRKVESFSTWGTENSLAEINLESMGL